jgi:uncharacterized protein
MKKIFSYFAGLLVLCANVVAHAQEQSLLWQVKGNGLTKPSYLFGTIHIICPADYLWTPVMKKSLEKSDKLCLEMDMDDNNVMMSATTGLMDHSGKKLSDYFTAEQYKLLSQFVKDSLGMEIIFFEKMKPIALQTLMASRGAAQCDNPVSYEDNIMKAALGGHKEVLGLETVEEQLSALESIPMDSVVNDIMEAITTVADDAAEYARLVAAYKSQDIVKLHQMIVQGEGLGDATTTLIDDRNKRWIGRMAGMMEKNSVFFAFGAGHLAGDTGVINLLRKQGYTVEPLK